jgi:hypothetical protein
MARSLNGPIFVVGMPRSGTKLLRALLNQHPMIKINTTETDFLPYWINHWESYGDLSSKRQFVSFYRSARKLNYMKVADRNGHMIGCDEWYEACRSYDPAGVFEALIRHDLGLDRGVDVLWGDKTPSYITKTALIKRIYPSARFIHIIRDVRDFCISINKAWNKNVYRAAQRWTDDVLAARQAGNAHGDYLEVRYEDILDDAERELRRICDFLNVDFVDDMQNLSRPCEKLGDARGHSAIKKDNKSKYRIELAPAMLSELETIAGGVLLEFGYPVDHKGPIRRIGRLRGAWYQLKDGVELIRRRKVRSITDVIVNANRQ